MPQASQISASLGSSSTVPPSAGIHTTIGPVFSSGWRMPMRASAALAAAEPLSRNAWGMPLRVNRLRMPCARAARRSATTTTSRSAETTVRDHSCTNSPTVRLNSSSCSDQGLRT